MDERDRTDSQRNDTRRNDLWDTLGDAVETAWRALLQLIREGNRRAIAFRNREGEVLLKLPLTVAALIALALLWWAWPALLLVALVLVALRGSVVILRKDRAEG